MSEQLHPVWQRGSVSSNRLAKVSAEFLSDADEPRQDKDRCQAIFFLQDNAELGWITDDLCQILNRKGHNSLLYRLGESPQDHRTEPSGEQLQSAEDNYEYCLFALTSIHSVSVYKPQHLVLLVPADLEAVLGAYQRIKLLARHPGTPEIGVVMVGPRDQHSAWRYFRKLAVGTLRYLDIPLLNLGFLPAHVTPDHGPANHHRNNFLTRISERLLRSEFYTACRLQDVIRNKI